MKCVKVHYSCSNDWRIRNKKQQNGDDPMKIRKSICVLCVLALGFFLWFGQYTRLNDYYRSLSDKQTEFYEMGEVVSFGEDYLAKDMCVNGYLIRVDRFEILDYLDYCSNAGFSPSDFTTNPEKIALVYITLFNDNSSAEGIMLTEFDLHGIDNYAGMNWEILLAANPVLEGNYGIRLSSGTEYSLVIPFDLNREYYGTDTWANLDTYQFYFRITDFPTEKDIRVQ